MDALGPYLPGLLQGLWVTIYVGVASIVGSGVVAIILGVARTLPVRPLNVASSFVIELLRGASAVIYLFWAYYALPMLPGGPKFTPLVASIVVLSLELGAYGAEAVRAGIQAVPRGQLDAAHALGLSPMRTMRKVLLPQALTQIVPAFGSISVDTVRATAIVSFVGVADLFYAANSARSIINHSNLIYGLLMAVYCVLCLLTATIFRIIERFLPMKLATRPTEPGATNRRRVLRPKATVRS